MRGNAGLPLPPGMEGSPAIDSGILQGSQHFLTKGRVLVHHRVHKIFGALAQRGTIGRAAAFDDGQPGIATA